MYKLKLKHHFDAAHKLENYNGACANLHGHRWDVLVEIDSEELENGMIIDFKVLKGIINKFDHKTIIINNLENNRLVSSLIASNYDVILLDFNPTAENLARYLQKEIIANITNLLILDVRVTLWESPDASITYEE